MWCLQTSSETTLEEAEGVYVTAEGTDVPLTTPVSMARFTALRSLCLWQANSVTLQSVTPGLPPSLRYITALNVTKRPIRASLFWQTESC